MDTRSDGLRPGITVINCHFEVPVRQVTLEDVKEKPVHTGSTDYLDMCSMPHFIEGYLDIESEAGWRCPLAP